MTRDRFLVCAIGAAGRKVTQFLQHGRYIAVVVDGKVQFRQAAAPLDSGHPQDSRSSSPDEFPHLNLG
jgi:hypothetical protein